MPGPPASEIPGVKLVVWSETERPQPLELRVPVLGAQSYSPTLPLPVVELAPSARQGAFDASAKRSSTETSVEVHRDSGLRVIP